MDHDEREVMLDSLRWFWTEKGDITRSVHFDKAAVEREFPEVIKAWNYYQLAKRVLTAVLNGVTP